MISDNFVTGDNVYLRELHDFFFEVLGMMSITHYGAIGDGRRDNYGPLQVAIDDAHRRGLSFLYVPYGKFVYTGELINLEGITFVGNPNSKIVNIRTEEEIKIYQFGWANGMFYNKQESDDRYVNVEGDTMSGSLAIGSNSMATGSLSLAQGSAATASGINSSAFGKDTVASGLFSHAEGQLTQATTNEAHAEGYNTTASGMRSHSEGNATTASGSDSHAEGVATTAGGYATHAEGRTTTASGSDAHAEGNNTRASGSQSHAEGFNSQAIYNSCHAEGTGTYASAQAAHAEGYATTASGYASHAGGRYTAALGQGSFAQGTKTTATRWNQFVVGKGNVIESGNANSIDGTSGILIVGNGTLSSDASTVTTPSNAFKVLHNGIGWFSGDVYVGSTSGTDMDAGSKKLISEADLQAFATLNNLQMPS